MQIHNFVQRSPEWHVHRDSHDNASDAPAMLGCSTYKTRNELLQEYATGHAKEIDSATQHRFDDGHRYEALARPLGEKIIGEDLYPVVGSEGRYSASFDGLTMGEDTGFEHKSLNDDLRAVMTPECTGADLPKMYRVQMEQQCMVSGALRILFMASKWEGDTLVEERNCWYYPDLELRAEIIAGWDQFRKDVDAYVPPEIVAKAVGRTQENLPALRIEVTGMVTASNLKEYKEHALAVFKGINRELTTDQHFADAANVVKWCGDVEDRLDAAKQHALSQTASIDELFRTIDDIKAEARRTRLELDKLVEARKIQLRAEIQLKAKNEAAAHIDALNERLGKPYMPVIPVDFATAMKGKKTIESLNNAVATELARFKIEASKKADQIQINLAKLREEASNHAFLFADAAQIVLKQPDDCAALIKVRISEHTAAEEKREAVARERIAEEERVKAEAKVREEQEAALAAERLKESLAVSEMLREPEKKPLAPAASAVTYPPLTAERAGLPMKSQPIDVGARIKLGDISARLGFAVTAEFLASIGFQPVSTERGGKWYRAVDFKTICAAIIRHVEFVAQETAEAA